MMIRRLKSSGNKLWASPQNIAGLLLITINFISCFIFNYKSTNILSSDMSSEMVLSSLLAQEKSFISGKWIYSTELRVFNTQIIMSLLFRFIKDWSLIRALGNSILYLTVYASAIFMFKQSGLSKDRLLLPTAVILLPFSNYQCIMLLVGGFYIPHIVFTFLILGCLFRILFRGITGTESIILGGVFYLIALAAGLSGIRYILIIFAPLCLAELWNIKEDITMGKIIWQRTFLIGSSAIVSGIGYLIYNKVLSKHYLFDSYNNISFIDVSTTDIGKRFSQVISGSLDSFLGYCNGVPFFSLKGIGNLCVFLCVFIMMVSFIFAFKNFSRKTSAYTMYFRYTICNILINYLVFIFTDGAFSSDIFVARYCGPVLIHGLLLVFLCLDNIQVKRYQHSLYAVLIGIFTLLSTVHFGEMLNIDLNECRNGSLEYIKEQNMEFGYATFWNANISTELTDGFVKIAPVYNFDTMAPFHYLTIADYEKENYTDKKCFILMTVQEYENSSSSPVLSGGIMEYRDDFFVIYTYPNSEKVYELAIQ